MGALTAIGCGEDAPTGPANQGPIMPLAIGNSWTTMSTLFNANGTIESVDYDTLIVKWTFIPRYVWGWMRAGFRYSDNWMEREAQGAEAGVHTSRWEEWTTYFDRKIRSRDESIG